MPAGAVAIANAQTAVYPYETPGGWSIIGRTPLRVFDPARDPASLFAPGDRVRFVADFKNRIRETAMSLRILRPGLLTTVQDRGRFGLQHLGVVPCGPMDPVALELANGLVGNRADEAALEITVLGPEIVFEADALIALCGAEMDARLRRRADAREPAGPASKRARC